MDRNNEFKNAPFFKRLRYPKAPVLELNPRQMEAKKRIEDKIEKGVYRFESAVSPCGAKPEEREADLLATVDRYGLKISTWLSKRSGLLWESPRMTLESLQRFYENDYRELYSSGLDKDLFFLSQVKKGIQYFGFLRKHCQIQHFDGSTVFDIGCGMGGVLEAFRLGGAKNVHGVDLGEEYVEEGKKRGLALIKGTAEKLHAFAPADIIILSHVLEHLSDPIEFLREISRLLKPHGTILLSVPGILNLKDYDYDFSRYLQNAHLFHFCKETLSALVGKAGYDVLASDQTVHMAIRKAENPREVDWDCRIFPTVLRYLKKCENIATYSDALYPVYEDGVLSKIRMLNRILDQKNLRLVYFDEKQRKNLAKGLADFIL